MFVPLPVSFFVVLFLFVLCCFLCSLFSWQFSLALLLRPHLRDIVEGQRRGKRAPKWQNSLLSENIEKAREPKTDQNSVWCKNRTSLNVPNQPATFPSHGPSGTRWFPELVTSAVTVRQCASVRCRASAPLNESVQHNGKLGHCVCRGHVTLLAAPGLS